MALSVRVTLTGVLKYFICLNFWSNIYLCYVFIREIYSMWFLNPIFYFLLANCSMKMVNERTCMEISIGAKSEPQIAEKIKHDIEVHWSAWLNKRNNVNGNFFGMVTYEREVKSLQQTSCNCRISYRLFWTVIEGFFIMKVWLYIVLWLSLDMSVKASKIFWFDSKTKLVFNFPCSFYIKKAPTGWMPAMYPF